MKRTVNRIYCFMPVAIYLCYMAIMGLRFGVSFFYMSLIVSLLGSLIYLVAFVSLKKDEVKCPLLLIFCISILLVFSLGSIGVTVGDDRETAIIAGAVIYSVMAFIFIFIYGAIRTRNKVYLDSASGKYYTIKGNEFHALTDNQVQTMFANGFVVRELSRELHGYTDSSMTVRPSDVTQILPQSANSSMDTYINPSSGLPMNGGISGLDIAGNSWGTNFNDPSNHQSYDPNRGY